MTKDQYKTGDSPFIRLDNCSGDLIIRGWAEPILQVRGDYQLVESEKGYSITCIGGLNLNVPRDAILSVGRVGGDLSIKQFTGSGSFEYVQGDAILSQTSDIDLGVVHGDLVARNLIGALRVNEVNGDMVARGAGQLDVKALFGDLSARVIDGNLTIESIHGDADLRTINGDVIIQQGFRDVNLISINGCVSLPAVTGDIRIRGGLTTGNHTMESRGDTVIRWPKGLGLNLTASSERIDNRIRFEETTEKNGVLTGKIGDSDINLSVKSMGRIILREDDPAEESLMGIEGDMEYSFDAAMAGIGARIEAEVNNHISRVTREIESKFGADFSKRINEKITRKMDRTVDRSSRRGDGRSRVPGSDFDQPESVPSKKSPSTEEQLKILKMVETGKISTEEGRMLLEALEV